VANVIRSNSTLTDSLCTWLLAKKFDQYSNHINVLRFDIPSSASTGAIQGNISGCFFLNSIVYRIFCGLTSLYIDLYTICALETSWHMHSWLWQSVLYSFIYDQLVSCCWLLMSSSCLLELLSVATASVTCVA